MEKSRSWVRVRNEATSIIAKRPQEALPADWDDLEYIYNLVKDRKIESCVEFGSGCSTAVFRQIVPLFTSYESDPNWAAISGARNAPCMQTNHPIYRKVWRYCTEYSQVHTHEASKYHHLVYLDGPELTSDCRITINPLFMDWKYLLIDGREDTFEFMLRNLHCEVLDRDEVARRYLLRRIAKW